MQDELRNIMTKLGDEPVGEDIIDEMIAEADLNGDGVIQYEGKEEAIDCTHP